MYRCFDVLVYCCTGPYVYSVRVRVGIGDGVGQGVLDDYGTIFVSYVIVCREGWR